MSKQLTTSDQLASLAAVAMHLCRKKTRIANVASISLADAELAEFYWLPVFRATLLVDFLLIRIPDYPNQIQ